MNIEIEQILTQIVAFLLMLWVLKRFAWKPFLEILHHRTDTIRSEFASIEHKQQEVQEMSDLYAKKLQGAQEEARRIIQEAIHESRLIAQNIQRDAQHQAKEMIQHAQEAAHQELNKAKGELRQEIITLSTALFEKLVRKKLDPKENQRLLDELLDEVKLS